MGKPNAERPVTLAKSGEGKGGLHEAVWPWVSGFSSLCVFLLVWFSWRQTRDKDLSGKWWQEAWWVVGGMSGNEGAYMG